MIRHDARDDNTPPHDEAAERALLGSYLIDPATLDNPASTVSPSDFHLLRHREAFAAIRKMHADGVPVDIVTLPGRLGNDGDAAKEVIEYAESVPHAGHARYYAKIVRNLGGQRRYLDKLHQEIARASEPDADVDGLRTDFRLALDALDGSRPTSRTLADVLAEWDPLDTTPPVRIDCGLSFDLRPGRIAMLAGSPGDGKTALAMQLTFDALRADTELQAVVCNVEVSPADLLAREVARISGISATSILNRDYYDGDTDRITYAIADIREIAGRLHLVDRHEITAIERECRRHNAGLVCLDYIQRIRPRSEHANRVDALDSLMGDVRSIASDGRCVLAISSLARSRTPNKGGHEKGMSGLRGSGELEYGGDSVYTIEADEMGDEITLRCHKDRHGPRRDIRLRYRRPIQSFTEAGL